MYLPNKLTVLRVMLIPLFVWFLLSAEPWHRYAATALFLIACITDFFDGYLARKMNLVTNFGRFMDPLADKLLVSAALIALVELEMLAGWVVIVLISREFAVTGFRLLAVEQGVVLAAGMMGKAKTAVQMIMIISVMLTEGVPYMQMINGALVILSVVLSVASATEYIYTNRRVLADLK